VSFGESADAKLRTLQIGQDGDGTAHLMFYRTNKPVTALVVCVSPMAEIEPEDIRSRLD